MTATEAAAGGVTEVVAGAVADKPEADSVTASAGPVADMAGDGDSERRSLLALWRDTYSGARDLAYAEVELLQAETRMNLRRFGRSVFCLVIGVFLLLPAIVFLATAGLLALAALIGTIWAALLMALLCGFLAMVLIGIARYRLARQAILPRRSLTRMNGALRMAVHASERD